jgi:hypothetical protein
MKASGTHPGGDRDYRPVAALVMAAIGVALVLLPFDLRLDVWRNVFGVPPMPESFGDLRGVTSGWDCLHRGIFYLPVNPCDPWAPRASVLPRLWLAPALLGLDQSWTDILGLLVAAAFVLAALAWVGRSGFRETAVVLLALLSPAAMLGMERGNVDLVVFSLLVLGLTALGLAVERGGIVAGALGAAVLGLAAMLKFYPAFALVPLAVRTRWALVGLVAFGVYIVATASDVAAINANVELPYYYAYGLGPLCQALGLPHERKFLFSIVGALVAAVVVAAVALSIRRSGRAASNSTFELGYVAAAAIYAGTFLLADSYPYKLVFLILAIPQALAWTRDPECRYLGVALLAAILAMMWVPRYALGPGWGSEIMAAISAVLFILLGSTCVPIVVRRVAALRPDLTLAVASRLRAGERTRVV